MGFQAPNEAYYQLICRTTNVKLNVIIESIQLISAAENSERLSTAKRSQK